MYQRDETEAYFTEAGENDWQEDESYAWYADDQWDMTWESAEASWYPETAWYGEASWYPETAWYGEDSSWNEGSCQDRSEEIVDDYFSEAKDAEQIAMEVQSAYLAGENNGTEPAVTYTKEKGRVQAKDMAKVTAKEKGKDLENTKAKDTAKVLERKDINPDQATYLWKIAENA